MIRLTELRLPLARTPSRAARRDRSRASGIDDAALRSFAIFRRGYDARKKAAIVLRLHGRLRSGRRSRGARAHAGDAACAARARHRAIASSPHAPADFAAPAGRARSSSASGRAASSRRWSSRRWAFGRSSSSAAARCASAPATPGACGASGVLDPESNVQFGEGGAGTFSDGKLWSQISDPRHLTRKVLDEFVKAGAPEEILLRRQAAHRHLPPGRRGREDARRDRVRSAARSASARASSIC